MYIVPKRPALRYYGAKWNLAEWVVSHFPPHTNYYEPFFGSGAVLFHKPPSSLETVNDISSDVFNFFKVLRTQTNDLLYSLELTPWSREEFDLSYVAADTDLEQARRFFVRMWMGIGSNAGKSKSTSWRYIKKMHDSIWRPPSQLWNLEHLFDIAERLKPVQIENKNVFDLADKFDSDTTLTYCDPPYVLESRRDKTGRYEFEFTQDDHKRLREMLEEFKGAVIVSGYPSELYEQLFADWETVSTKFRANANRSKNEREEVLWLNPAAAENIRHRQESLKFA